MTQIKFLADTALKQSTEQATQLPEDQKQLISRGTLLALESFENEVDHHIKITLKDDVFKGLKTWFVFADHVSPSYEHNTPENPHRGANLHYSYTLMDALAGPNGKVWSHFPKQK
jgi:hypothetical protein